MLSIDKTVAEATSGQSLYEAIRDAVKLAAETAADVELVHNGKRFKVDWATIHNQVLNSNDVVFGTVNDE